MISILGRMAAFVIIFGGMAGFVHCFGRMVEFVHLFGGMVVLGTPVTSPFKVLLVKLIWT